MDWTGSEDSGSLSSNHVETFEGSMEEDFGFPDSVPEIGIVTFGIEVPKSLPYEKPESSTEDRSLGESNTHLSSKWIQRQLVNGTVPPMPSGTSGLTFAWINFRKIPEVNDRRKSKPSCPRKITKQSK